MPKPQSMDFPDDQLDGFNPDKLQPAQRQGSTSKDRSRFERYDYKTVRLSEGVLGAMLTGSSNLDTKKLETILNEYAMSGYRLVFQVLEQKRTLLFWKRESLILTFERPLA
ncbi:MAG: DUF4177 domain-containing protein [Phycisphaerales bacterium]